MAAAAADNPGPHRVRQTQVACQNLSDYDRFRSAIDDAKASRGERAKGIAQVRALYDHEDPRHQGRYCLTLRKGTMATVEKRFGRFECVRFRAMPPVQARYNDTCYWATGISSYRNIEVPGVNLYGLE